MLDVELYESLEDLEEQDEVVLRRRRFLLEHSSQVVRGALLEFVELLFSFVEQVLEFDEVRVVFLQELFTDIFSSLVVTIAASSKGLSLRAASVDLLLL